MPGTEKKKAQDRARMKRIRAEMVIMPVDPPMEVLQAMYEAMFIGKWDGSDAPMIGAGYDAVRNALRGSSAD